jgi:hypothetical protein
MSPVGGAEHDVKDLRMANHALTSAKSGNYRAAFVESDKRAFTAPVRRVRYIAMALLVAVCCCSDTARPRAQIVKQVGHGAAKCERFTRDVAADMQNIRPYLAWAQGYMSGIIFYAPTGENENVDIGASNLSIPEQIQFLQNYCLDSPTADFGEAAFALFSRLGGRLRDGRP